MSTLAKSFDKRMNDVLFIDNHDSFSYNLVDYCRYLGMQVHVYANDELCIPQIQRLNPSFIILSPGPNSPEQSGISLAIIAHFWRHTPILGVCLGHQCLGYFFGAKIIRAERPVHGRTECIEHSGTGLFKGLPAKIRVTRYHSLIIEETSLHKDFTVEARSMTGEIMAIRHRHKPLYGLQFHPEALLSEFGMALLRHFFFTHSLL